MTKGSYQKAHARCLNCDWGAPSRHGRNGVDNTHAKARRHALATGHIVTVSKTKTTTYVRGEKD